jgi:uncharacterized protein YoxC
MAIEIIKEYINYGLPTVAVILAFAWLWIYSPKFMKKSEERQRKFEELLAVVVTVTQQGNAIIANNTAAMGKNTKAFDSIEAVVSKVDNSVNRVMGNVEKGLDGVSSDLKIHCRDVDGIRIGIEKLLERSNVK